MFHRPNLADGHVTATHQFRALQGLLPTRFSGPGDFHARAICWFMGMLEIRKILNLKLGYRREDLSAMQRSFW